jgi:glycosyltransferase involved in cell wall biosynthesis
VDVLFNTYPMAFHTPGGGEIQLKAYQSYLPAKDISVSLLDQWEPDFNGADLVHFFSCQTGSLGFCAFIKSLNIPLLISPNLWITVETKHHYPMDEIRNQFLQSDGIVVNSDMEGDTLSSVFNLPREWFHTIYNAVDESFFSAVDPRLFLDHFKIKGPFVLNVGNIEPRKNQLNLVRAMKAYPDYQLVIIGHQRDIAYATDCLVEGGDQLQYIEALPHDSKLLRSAYAACEVFALPSTLETPGLAALEAVAAGASVVVTSEGSTREYFGELVDYVNFDDIEEITYGIGLAKDRSEPLLGQIYLRTNFIWEKVTGHLADLYEDIQNEHEPRKSNRMFYPIEKDAQENLYMWSRHHVEFEWAAGQLRFLWRSVDGATVTIKLDNESVVINAEVSSVWSWMVLDIIVQKDCDTALVAFDITPNVIDDSSGARQFGVALREVSFEPAIEGVTGYLADLYRGVYSENNSLSSRLQFYPIEKDAQENLYMWSRHHVEFEWAPGQLRFLWRSVDGATVSIKLDNESLVINAEVSSGWSWMTLDIIVQKGRDTALVAFDITPNVFNESSGDRQFGMALREVSFEPAIEGVTGYLADLYHGVYSENNSLSSRLQFYPIEKDAQENLYMWSRRHVEFEWAPGQLRFLWRSVDGATVTIKLDNESVIINAEVSSAWNWMTLDITVLQGRNTAVIVFEILPDVADEESDPRQLGIALRDISFEPAIF